MHRYITFVFFAGLLCLAQVVSVQAQGTMTRGGMSEIPEHRVEIIPMGGYVWTVSQDASVGTQVGEIDLKSSGFWAIAADFNVHPIAELRLLYRRQETDVQFRQRGGVSQDLAAMNVEYWHIGAVKGIPRGKVKPYTSFTLGGTRYSSGGEDNWKFSVILGLGAKVYLSERVGLVLGGQMPWTFTDAFLGIGTGGLSIGGSGIVQFDLVGGVMINI